MSSYGVRITLSLPTSGQVTWDGTLNDFLQAVSDVIAARVTPDGMNITGPLDMQGNALVDIAQLGFTPLADAPIVGPCFYVDSAGEIHYVDADDQDVQLTLGGSIDVTSTGGIGGQYIAAGAHLNYVAASNTYTFTDASLSKSNATFASVTVNSLTGSTALINSTLTVGGGGQFTGGGLSITGSVSATQSGSFQVTRAGRDILHDATFSILLPASMGSAISPASQSINGFITLSTASGSNQPVILPLPVKALDRITDWKVNYSKTSNVGQITAVLQVFTNSGQTVSTPGTVHASAPGAANATIHEDLSSNNSSLLVLSTGQSAQIMVNGGGTSGDLITSYEYSYTRQTGSV